VLGIQALLKMEIVNSLIISLRLDKAKAEGYKILSMKFLSYFLLILVLAMVLVPATVKADG
jgi:hypothetical protein